MTHIYFLESSQHSISVLWILQSLSYSLSHSAHRFSLFVSTKHLFVSIGRGFKLSLLFCLFFLFLHLLRLLLLLLRLLLLLLLGNLLLRLFLLFSWFLLSSFCRFDISVYFYKRFTYFNIVSFSSKYLS